MSPFKRVSVERVAWTKNESLPLPAIIKQGVAESVDVSLCLHSLYEERSRLSLKFSMNWPVSQDFQHLFPSALTPVAWPQPVQRRISILVWHFNFHLRKKSVNCPNIFYISLTFSISSRCLELLWSPCICRSEDPWKSIVWFLIVLKLDAGPTSKEGIHLKASHISFSSQEPCV